MVGTAEDALTGYGRFRSSCLASAADIERLLHTRHVQVNNIHRCAVLFPALCMVRATFPDRPCCLVDLGTSAGLHLLADLCSYAYPELGGRVFTTKLVSEIDLELEFEWRGSKPLDNATFFRPPRIVERIGIDLNPIDLENPEQLLWFQAFTEMQPEVLEAVIALRQLTAPRLVQADVFDWLGPWASSVSPENLIVAMHSFLTVQFSDEARERFGRELDAIGRKRDLAVVVLDNRLGSKSSAELWLHIYREGNVRRELLACCQHPLDVGEWLEWRGPVR